MYYSLEGVHMGVGSDASWRDGDRVFHRGWRLGDDGSRRAVLVVLAAADEPARRGMDRLANEYGLKDELDGAWAARPLELVQDAGRPVLILEDAGGAPLELLLGGRPMELGPFLRLAISAAAAIGKVHRQGLVHKDLKPANILVNDTGEVRLTGFGIASRIAFERQSPQSPETIAGTLAYMSPEQTGRMNRSIDGRSDLYSLGVCLYRMLTGSLPFTADEPIEWIHAHVARPPVAPGERVANVPAPVSAIVMKLLSKTSEERYQTAAGLERDLRRCLAEWEAERRIDAFPLGEHDTLGRLDIPEKLYGRAREIESLRAAFDRVARDGLPELVLVSGFSGIGKTSVGNALRSFVVSPRALFAAGKFDQYNRDIPYSTLAQALESLVGSLLAKSDLELGNWRESLRAALGQNGRLMVDLVPQLKLIIGEQPSCPELPPQDAQRRFQQVLRRFLAVFARADHPLALFLDDLQWLDAATLVLLEDLLTHPDVRHLLLIGAYRDNEVTTGHPLVGTLDRIRSAGTPMHEIFLAPLTKEHVGQLVADSLHSDRASTAPLAELLHRKTAGNPFFGIQFLSALVDEGMLAFDHGAEHWSWDLARIDAKGHTDNVIDLMLGKLTRMPLGTQRILQRLACLGGNAEPARLALVTETADEELGGELRDALQSALVLHADGSYRFLHDRVQEAAYSLIPETQRAAEHLRIGRLLVANTPADQRDEAIFEIVNQLNRAAGLISSRAEREQVAEFNLAAAERARSSTAYASALNYLVAGELLLSDGGWETRPDLMFAFELLRAECEFLTGELASAETRLTMLSARAVAPVDRAKVTCLRSDVYTTLDRSDRAVEVCLEYLRHLGIDWSPHPTREEAREEYDQTWKLLGRREIEELVDLPMMSDPEVEATMEVLSRAWSPATFTDINLQALVLLRMVNLSQQFGNTETSCQAYSLIFAIAGPQFGDHEVGRRFGRLGYELVERRGFKRFQARSYLAYGVGVVSETGPLRDASSLCRRAFEAANASGDLTFAAYSLTQLVAMLLLAGEPLDDVQDEAERGLEYVKRARFGLAIDILASQLALVRTLRGLNGMFGSLDGEQFDELQMERRLASDPRLAFPEWWYWMQKLPARFFASDYPSAVDASRNLQRLVGVPDNLVTAEAHFYSALSHAALSDGASPMERRQHLEALAERQRQLQTYADRRLARVRSRAELVNAEIARVEGRELEAERLYEDAIRSAHENQFVHNEALGNELAARFYADRGLHTAAHAYLKNARNGYLQWGADAKVRQLDELYPNLAMDESFAAPTGTIGTSLEQLDLRTVIKVSQAVSAEVVLEKLLDTVMRAAIEHAGAGRALLILMGEAEADQRIVAEVTSSDGAVAIRLNEKPVDGSMLPMTVLRYTLHTREIVVVDDAAFMNPFSQDPYIARRHARSVLSVPLTTQAKLIGVLYFENNLAPGVFAPARIAVLKLLASQAAISLDYARLYRDLEEREREARLIVNTIPGLIASLTPAGEVDVVNDQLAQYCGQPVEAMRQWGTNGIVHSDDVPHVTEVFSPAIASGQPFDLEARIRRYDGDYRWFQIRGLPLRDTRGQIVRWYALLSDVDDRKRAEVELRQAYDSFVDAQRLSKTGSFITDLVADDHNWSEETYRIFGFEPGTKVTLQRIRATIHPEDFPSFEAMIGRAMTGVDVKFSFRVLTGSPGVTHVRGVAHVVEKTEGRPLFVGALQDVTESAVADEALRESERETRLIVNTIPGLVAILDSSGEIEVVNDQLVAYCGQPLEAMRQWGTNGIVHPEDVPHAVGIFGPAITTGDAFEFEARLRRFDGVYRWFQIRGLPLRDTRGQVVRWYSLNSDVDDRKRAEVELKRAYDSFVDAQRLSKTGSFIADIVADDNIFSEEALRIFELDPATKITVERIREVIHPDDLAGWDAMIARAMSGVDVTFAYRIITPAGAVKHVRGVAHVQEKIAGRPLFVGAVQDVTESIVAEEALNRARSELAHITRVTAMGELTASIAHEVKQPIAAAVTSAQTALRWLEARPPELGEVRDALSRVVRAGKRAGDVVGRIRALITKAPPRKDAVDINAAIREVVELTRGEAVKNRVAVRMDLADGLPLIEGDRVQLQQVILNLIINGFDATSGLEGSRELRITSRRDGSEGVRIAVADTGRGLAGEPQEQIFAAFYTTKPGGLGLGLSICRSIIEAHDGRLWASANEPRGAVFQFTLPIPAR